jgi:hypothetical protein
MGKVIIKVMNTIYETGKFPAVYCMIYKAKGNEKSGKLQRSFS